MSIWFSLFTQPLTNLLIFMYQALGNNLGWAIIATTVAIRSALIPLMIPSTRSAQAMQMIKPELDKLKEKYKDDKHGLAQAQLALYREKGINPMGGILPMIVQIVILIALFQVLNTVIKVGEGSIADLNAKLYPFLQLDSDTVVSTKFWYLDLAKPDLFHLTNPINLGIIKLDKLPGFFLIASAVFQYLSSLFMAPMVAPVKTKSPTETEGPEAMMGAMQKQMQFMMPLLTLVIGYQFPSGLVLYWITFSLVMIIQQYWTRKKVPAIATP